MKNESKVSLASVKDEEEHLTSRLKIPNNIITKKGLKLEGGSMNERELHMPSLSTKDEELSSFAKKKSHTNLQTLKMD